MMFSGVFFIAVGGVLLFFGITEEVWFDIILGIVMILYASVQLFLLATGKGSLFNKKDKLDK